MNWERIDKEVKNLRRRVTELEHLCITMSKELAAMRKRETQAKIDDYLMNYKPKSKDNKQ